MELRHLVSFQAIVKEGSFLQAAEKLRYAQSTITIHMQQLEAELGVSLFVRRGKHIQLTEAGRALQEQADTLTQRARALQQALKDVVAGEAGHLRIGAIEPTASLRLPPLLVQFCQTHPKLHLTLEVGSTHFISQQVATGALDVGICSPPTSQQGLVFDPLFVEPLTVLLPETHPLASRASLVPADLLDQRVLLKERGCEYRALIETALLARGTNPFSGIEIGSTEVLKRTVQEGLGIAIIPRAAAIPLLPHTVIRDLRDVALRLPVGLVSLPEVHSPGRALGAFLTLLRTQLQESIPLPK
ncbi:LysR family transcriptional regulator [Ktedonobacter sp. SOSP1-52]|uniref:LysR family transcriptional regulator n=1 Tax=Ktedonobacter sp. SOSP1-52 TaxID=2778366 RepID=UPI001914DCAF|nr:LysR family transcriptional regulator [Ktedonobacter sp. SOSP1-52]GHO63683.1 LysR family transcriptional regulator [Ktedonobacter sp. SOSP1-52]